LADYEFELISLDDAWQAATCDAVAAQIRDAGINIKRTVLPGSTFWNDWTKYPFSPPNGTCGPWACRSWRWPTDRRGLERKRLGQCRVRRDAGQGDVDRRCGERSKVMERIEQIMQEEGVMMQPTGARSTATSTRR
jgi:peptide/nickel transport system substrate-binding protein